MNEINMGDQALQAIKDGAALMRLENDTQMQVAIQRPRDEKQIIEDCLAEMSYFPETADIAIYRKPVGKVDGVMQYAEGLSVRAAESIACRYDNSAVGCEVIGEDDESITIGAVFLDYQRNRRYAMQKRVPKFYKPRNSRSLVPVKPQKLALDVDAARSKLLREVILRALPASMKIVYERKAREIRQSESIETRIKKMIAAFRALNVTEADIERHTNKKLQNFGHADIDGMYGVYNAIRGGEIKVSDVFGGTEGPTPPEQVPPTPGPVTLNDVMREPGEDDE